MTVSPVRDTPHLRVHHIFNYILLCNATYFIYTPM
nr:MAG TPA: hypothetical protein [Caudoviricetes sp.]